MFKFPNKISVFLLSLIAFSCVNDVNFDQANDFVLKPIFTASFTNFTLTPIKFFDATGTIQQNSISDISKIDFFQRKEVEESLVQLDFIVEISNNFNRAFTIKADFLDDAGNLLYQLTPLQIAANTTDFKNSEKIDLKINPQVKRTTQIVINAEVENTGTPLNPNDTSEFKFKSALVFYIEKRF